MRYKPCLCVYPLLYQYLYVYEVQYRENHVNEEEYFDTIKYNAFDNIVDDLIDSVNPQPVTDTHVATLTNVYQEPNFDLFILLFGWALVDTIKRPFDVTTQ
jgi:predicted Zn-dependent protease